MSCSFFKKATKGNLTFLSGVGINQSFSSLFSLTFVKKPDGVLHRKTAKSWKTNKNNFHDLSFSEDFFQPFLCPTRFFQDDVDVNEGCQN